MQTFSTADGKHEFTIDGVEYFLPAITVTDLEEINAFIGLDLDRKMFAFRDFVLARVHVTRPTLWQRFTRRPARAIRALSTVQLTQLFKAWSGIGKSVTPGESESSTD